jgi:hypothetical protein
MHRGMLVYMHTYTHTNIHVHIHAITYSHAHIHTCMHTYIPEGNPSVTEMVFIVPGGYCAINARSLDVAYPPRAKPIAKIHDSRIGA